MKRPLDQLAEIAQQATAIGSRLIKAKRPETVTDKSDRDIYTNVDLEIERTIRTFLAEQTPEIGFIGEEEGGYTESSAPFWALDPIDGTANFVHGIPLCAVQIALIDNDTVTVGAISLPYTDTNYWAARGCGSYANGSRIAVSRTIDLAKSVVSIGDYATGTEAAEKNKRRLEVTATLAAKVERVRMFGSAAYDFAWLAEGRIDAVVMLSNNLLDVAAGALLAEEAGARITDSTNITYSLTSSDIIAATPGVSEALVSNLR